MPLSKRAQRVSRLSDPELSLTVSIHSQIATQIVNNYFVLSVMKRPQLEVMLATKPWAACPCTAHGESHPY